MTQTLGILHDGRKRHEAAQIDLAKKIRVEVEAEFAEQLAEATWWQWVNLQRQIRQEVARRLPKPPSRYNLHGKS